MNDLEMQAVQEMDRGRTAIMELIRLAAVTDADIAMLRRECFADRDVTRDEAEALFELERTARVKGGEWTTFFVEAITNHIVWQVRPTGIVNTPQAEWLIEQVDRTASVNGLAALVNVIAEAHRVPMWLPAAARGRAGAGWAGVDAALKAAQAEAA